MAERVIVVLSVDDLLTKGICVLVLAVLANKFVSSLRRDTF